MANANTVAILIVNKMTNQADQKRIQQVFQMLFEMATGNFTHRIPEDDRDDETSTIAKILNKTAETMTRSVNKSGYIIPFYTYQSLVQATFVLTKEFQIESCSSNIPEMLGYPAETLYKNHFIQIIATNSVEIVQQIHACANQQADYFNTLQVNFKGATGSIVPQFCTFSRLLYSDKIIVNLITTILHDFIDYTAPTASSERPKHAAVIQQLHKYIVENLDTPLPNIKQLAKLFGSNTFTLKDGFRYFFNTSIYHFYNEQRLKKAHDLLQQTTYAVKEIGYMTGFNDYPTFYRAFKRQYGYAPSDLNRKKNDENNQ